jgi:hypothetical protein
MILKILKYFFKGTDIKEVTEMLMAQVKIFFIFIIKTPP